MAAKSQLTTGELVDRARSGDADACRQLVRRHQQKVYSLAIRMVRQAEDAEDVLQETFLSAFRALPSFRAESEFSTWLYRIATNCALMKLRRNKMVLVSIDAGTEDDATSVELTDFSADPIEDVLNGELRDKLEAALARLPEDMRIVSVLRDVEGLRNGEVAGILGLSLQAVKSRLHRARLLLRRELAAYFAERSAGASARKPRRCAPRRPALSALSAACCEVA